MTRLSESPAGETHLPCPQAETHLPCPQAETYLPCPQAETHLPCPQAETYLPCRLPARLRLIAIRAASLVLWGVAAYAGGPSGCENISAAVPFTQVSYSLNIQPIFNSGDCLSCHGGGGGAAGLNLEALNSYQSLLSPSTGNPRVLPGDPINSVLFLKINCDNPGFGSRMPMDLNPLSAVRQQLIFDWIRLGAPLLRAGFEDR